MGWLWHDRVMVLHEFVKHLAIHEVLSQPLLSSITNHQSLWEIYEMCPRSC